MLDADRDEATIDEVEAVVEVTPKDKEISRVTEPTIEERTKPDGIKL